MEKVKKDFTIWDSDAYLEEDFLNSVREDMKCALTDDEEPTDEEVEDEAFDRNNSFLEDITDEVGEDDSVTNGIVCLGDLGLWDGRHRGIKYFNDISSCFSTECDTCQWFVDENGDFCSLGVHHDGYNNATYRRFKHFITDEQKHNFEKAYFKGTLDRKKLNRYTEPLGATVEHLLGII